MRSLKCSILLASALLIACGGGDDDNPVDSGSGGTTIDIPTAYVFDSRFNEGESSVAYSGQTVRNLLLQDLKIAIDNLGKEGAEPISVDDLLKLYAYDDGLDLESLRHGRGHAGGRKSLFLHFNGQKPSQQNLE